MASQISSEESSERKSSGGEESEEEQLEIKALRHNCVPAKSTENLPKTQLESRSQSESEHGPLHL